MSINLVLRWVCVNFIQICEHSRCNQLVGIKIYVMLANSFVKTVSLTVDFWKYFLSDQARLLIIYKCKCLSTLQSEKIDLQKERLHFVIKVNYK